MATKQSYLKDESEPEPKADADEPKADADEPKVDVTERAPNEEILATDTTGMASQNAARNQ